MIDFESYHEFRRLFFEFRLKPRQIAARTGLEIKTVRKWLAKARYQPRSKPSRRPGKLDPYKDLIIAWLRLGAQARHARLCSAEHNRAYVPNRVMCPKCGEACFLLGGARELGNITATGISNGRAA